MNNLCTLINALNVEIGKEFNEQAGSVIVSSNNFIKHQKVPHEAIEEALNNAGYYHEYDAFIPPDTFTPPDSLYTNADLTALAKIIDAYGADLDLSEVRDKQIWFERVDMI